MDSQQIKLGFIGFGHVLKALARLLLERGGLIEEQYGIRFSVVGISTHSHGNAINPAGIDLAKALTLDDLSPLGEPSADVFDFIAKCPAEVMLEATWVNPQTGQPATDYCRAALLAGKSVVTANKGPVAFAHKELTGLAQERGRAFFYESTVMDGAPLHSLKREGLLANQVVMVRGILNSTTNSILSRMEQEISFEEALREMQAAGTAEADPSNDVDGWDAAIKLVILANTFMGADLRPSDVQRTGIRDVKIEDVQQALASGKRLKLICEARIDGSATVAPQVIPLSDPLAWLEGTSSGITISTEILDHLTLTKSRSTPRTTAYGMLMDTLNIARGRR